MSNKPFVYQDPFPLKKDDTEYYLLSSDHVSVSEFAGQEVLKVEPQALTLLAQHAFHDASFMLRPAHQQQVADILSDPEASENDKYVALQFLRNSDIAAKGILPTCQDTGTAIITGKKGQRVWTGGGDEAALAQGVYNTYIQDNLRYSQNAALDMYKEVNTGTNLPAQIDLYATDGEEYKFLCIAKGGGSANKTYLYQETKALITPAKLKDYLVEKMRTLGTAACPPYHIAFVIGGTSAESTLKTVKLASTHYYDGLPTEGNEHGQAFRDVQLEQELLLAARNLGLGAQFGGKYFAHDIRVVRLPRHGASCPVGMGVSCSADRNIKAKINRHGIWLEKLESNPGKYIPQALRQAGEGEAVKVNLNQPMSEIRALLSQYPVSTRLSLSGTIIVARDIAHAKLKELLEYGEALPQYVNDHPSLLPRVRQNADGYASGSLGPTTAGRMDSYVDLLRVARREAW
jgi:fumarate hydratase class I